MANGGNKPEPELGFTYQPFTGMAFQATIGKLGRRRGGKKKEKNSRSYRQRMGRGLRKKNSAKSGQAGAIDFRGQRARSVRA